jgi:hypothetical protein
MDKNKLRVVWDRREPLPESTRILQPSDRGWVLPGPWCKHFPYSRAFTVVETHIAQAGYQCKHDRGPVFGWAFKEVIALEEVSWHRRLYWMFVGLFFKVMS